MNAAAITEEKIEKLYYCSFCGKPPNHVVVTKMGKRMLCCFRCAPIEREKWQPYVVRLEPLPLEIRKML
ncbi:MAG: hypothetical protein A2998_02430 [Candidatus Staskawiczbacteria bacterium RIFCSPLOWO2_01_FULL_37_25b]|uniref:Uncharacterized protein n=2 Tax=Candidatus Staskawicziibacteriota TaxID=1817916 RepID=A0A1G2HSA3_9BACT|nr:MAG: hypothetical protein A2812_03560 [Candidatus Staskawiczbacteria bacterium RIFCSPHIGHO2_01_FULL_36_16]OGZ73086.1 MAG: hypothetical protein A2998_02430 [Candidatus Staskawiczbacteria bacterium RIFCSPLOWO2_01_FULL_37_25b]